MRFKVFQFSWIAVLLSLCVFSVKAGKVAIVIDDIGYKSSDKKLLELNGDLTFAVLPHTPYAQEYAQQAYANNRDVIIHLPMQAYSDNRLLGPGALTKDMNKRQFQQTLTSALENIPFAIGVNNHMGSLLTQMETPMSWTMEFLAQHNLFFLDSRTTKFSKISDVANDFGVGNVNRHVFLDHNKSQRAIRWQLKQLVRLAKRQGQAIAIAHPYPETYQVLADELPKLKEQGIELVALSSLIPAPNLAATNTERTDRKDSANPSAAHTSTAAPQ